MHRPPALAPGARVALVAPAGPLRGAHELDAAIANANGLGWDALPGAYVLARAGYLAGDDAPRAQDLDRAFADDKIDGIWCVRGGYGTTRLLSQLDFAALRRHPKAVIGYSDITALHAAIGVRAGIVSFHGPTARAALTDFSRDSLVRATVTGADPCGTAGDVRVLRGGRVAGRLVGGNLALLASLAGTPFAPDYDRAILILEDVGEATYRIDRMLRQLELSGALGRIAGLVVGHFTEGTRDDEHDTDITSRKLDDVLREAADVAGVPAIAGAPIGHLDDQWTIPLGAHAELDADRGTLHVASP